MHKSLQTIGYDIPMRYMVLHLCTFNYTEENVQIGVILLKYH